MLRYVDSDSATVWVQTDAPCRVTVRCGDVTAAEETWPLHGYHFALVRVSGLTPGTTTPYEVELDGSLVWPADAASGDFVFPPSVIRTLPDDDIAELRISFGSCYRADDLGEETSKQLGADALVALARFMAQADIDEWPHALCLLGDQIYADNPPETLADKLTRGDDGLLHAVTFGEYEALYEHAWMQPDVRWLLSTVPSCMILDDHDLRDDWNTSAQWRAETSADPRWSEIVAGAISSYCVYQHLGNLSPTQLDEDPCYHAITSAATETAREQFLREFALKADARPEEARWSFFRDFGVARLIMLDTRCSRDLGVPGRRMLDEREWAWTREQALTTTAPHILFGTPLPVLMLPGIHQLEGWNEAVCAGSWGPKWVERGERIRRALDLEHWGAFRASFDDMVDLVRQLARKPKPPLSICWLSGDVHSSYIARGVLDEMPDAPTAITQLTMSPFRNPLPNFVRQGKKLLGAKPVARAFRWFAQRAKVDDIGLDWKVPHGPWFRNGVMTLVLTPTSGVAHVDHAVITDEGYHRLSRTITYPVR